MIESYRSRNGIHSSPSVYNARLERIVASSLFREHQKRESLLLRRKKIEQQKLAEANDGRFLSLKVSDGGTIISVHLRRKPFLVLRRKSKKTKLQQHKTVVSPWVFYKDIILRGEGIKEASNVITEESGGAVYENALELLKLQLREKLVEGNFSVGEAYSELLSFDPKVQTILDYRNLEYGFQIKQPMRVDGKQIPKFLYDIINPIYPVSDDANDRSKLMMELAEMEDIKTCIEPANGLTVNSENKRWANFQNVIDDFIVKSLIPLNITQLSVIFDGSAKYHDYKNQTDLCGSVGIVLLPMRRSNKKMNNKECSQTVENFLPFKNHSLFLQIYPVCNLSTPFEAEIIAGIAALGIVEIIADRMRAWNGSLGKLEVQFNCDSRALVKAVRDILDNHTGDSKRISTNSLIKILQTKLNVLGNRLGLSFNFKWIQGHPESAFTEKEILQ